MPFICYSLPFFVRNYEVLTIVPDVANMTLPIFLIWGVWGMLLTGLMVLLFWLCAL